MVIWPKTLEDLMEEPPRKPVKAILKRNGEVVFFDLTKIAEAVRKASKASGIYYSDSDVMKFAEEVKSLLEAHTGPFGHSGSFIPHTDDLQDAVLEVFDERNIRNISNLVSERFGQNYQEVYTTFRGVLKEGREKNKESGKDEVILIDPTGTFYQRYMEARDTVREKLVHLPFDIELDTTDTQLQIKAVSNGRAHTFNAEAIKNLILNRTTANYNDAVFAVKKVQQILAARTSDKPVSADEFVLMIDYALMERGYSKDGLLGGGRLNITLEEIDKLIFSKSVENSNIQANNPEAVNLGIAELALKELALRRIFDDDVAEAHRKGMIHLHDLGYPIRAYCSAHSIEYIKEYGIDKPLDNLDAKSSPATKPTVLNNHIHTFLAAIQSSYAGALGFPMVNTLYGPMLLREVELIEGEEILIDETGKEVARVPRTYESETLESILKDNQVKFVETRRRKILRYRSDKELKEIAQNLIFGASQSAFSRGGQTLFIDFNIDLGVPGHLVNVPALFGKSSYVRTRKNDRGEWEIVNKSKEEPSRIEGLMENVSVCSTCGVHVGKGDKTCFNCGSDKLEITQEPSKKNGDVLQPEDGSVYATYGHEMVREASRRFARAMLEVFKDGDKSGRQFNFPKCDVHVGRETFEDPAQNELLKYACEVIEHNDGVYIMFDRGDGMNVAQCCRLRERITDPSILKHPEKMRFCGFQNVSINLPQAGYRAQGETLDERVASTLEEIEKAMLIALKAHTNKRRYIQKLLDTDGSPLRAMGKPCEDREPYIDLKKATYILGVVGLNELVQHLTGKELHEDPEAYKLGLKIVSHMYSVKSKMSQDYGMKFVIEETPGESANRRLAKIDQEVYKEQAKKVLKGDFAADTVYYSNSGHLRPDAPVDGLTRVILQSKTNPMIEAGAITHLFTGEKQNKAAAAYDMIEYAFFNTQSSQIVFSGEHTICAICGAHLRGLHNSCLRCGNDDPRELSQKTRVVGYFSDPRMWNKSKQGELKDRQKAQEFYAGEKPTLYDLEADVLKSIIEPGKVRFAVVGKKGCKLCHEVEGRIENYVSKLPEEARKNIEIVKYDVENEEDRVKAAIYDAPIDNFPTVIVHKDDEFARTSSEFPYEKPSRIVSTGDLNKMYKEITQQAA